MFFGALTSVGALFYLIIFIKEKAMEVKKTVNRRNLYKEGTYPYNLLTAVKDGHDIEFPTELTADNLAGLEYVISKLPPNWQEIIRQRYEEKKTKTEIAKLFSVTGSSISGTEQRSLRILRHPRNVNIINLGLEGFRQFLRKNIEEIENTPITKRPFYLLDLSTRTYNGLVSAGCRLVEEVAVLSEAEIMQIKKLGPKCRNEVAVALQKHGIVGTQWEKYL